MKTGTIVAIVCWSLAAVVILGIMITALVGGVSVLNPFQWGISFGDGGKAYTAVEKYELTSANIKHIEIDWTSGKVEVVPYDGDKIYFEESAASALKDNHKLYFEESGDKLTVKYVKGVFGWGVPNKNLIVKVPQKTAKDFSRINIKSASANVSVNQLSAEALNLQSVSGNIVAQDASCKTAELSTTSGEITTAALKAETCNASSVSGDILLAGSLQSVSLSTTSGEITTELKDLKSISANTVSGDVDILTAACPESMKISTTSGDMKTTLPENDGFTAKFHSVSGDFDCMFPVTSADGGSVYKNGGAQLSFNSTSGDAQIIKAE